MTEYDTPWKEVFDTYLKEFLELCLPAIHEAVDWSFAIENQEQELPRLFPASSSTGRVADKLFRVRVRSDQQPTWILIHTEIQVSRVRHFARRMFTCYYRILDRYQEPVVCIGVIADISDSWRPSSWEHALLGCTIRFSFPVVKLRDFLPQREALAASPNPFATVILAHLTAQDSHGKSSLRLNAKTALVRRLYERNWGADQVRSLFRFIDWVMDLPQEFELEFRDRVLQIEREKQMQYVTSIERLAKDEGKIEGKQEGKLEGKVEGKVEGKLIGKIQLLQELLGKPVMGDTELEELSQSEQEQLLSELRQQLAPRQK